MARAADQKSKEVFAKWKKFVERVTIVDAWIKSVPKQRVKRRATENKELSEISAADKHLISLPLAVRTDHERKYLAQLFGKMACLTDIPPKVRARMSRVCMFMEVEMGAKLIEEKTEPLFVYFIMGGQVETTRLTYNESLRRNVKQRDLVNVLGTGTCVGHYDIILKTSRKYTYTAITDVDVIYMTVRDYIKYVMPFSVKKWEMQLRAIRSLPYFQDYSEKQILEASQLCVMQQWGMYDHIYSKDGGDLSNVYFVLSGECMIVQVLRVQVAPCKSNPCEKVYELVEIKPKPPDASDSSSEDGLMTNAVADDLNFNENDIDEALKSDEKQKFDISAALKRCGMSVPASVLEEDDTPKDEKKEKAIPGVFYRYLNVSRSIDSLTYGDDINIQIIRSLMKPKKKRKDKELLETYVLDDLMTKITRMTKIITDKQLHLESESSSSSTYVDSVKFPSFREGEEARSYSDKSSSSYSDEIYNAIELYDSPRTSTKTPSVRSVSSEKAPTPSYQQKDMFGKVVEVQQASIESYEETDGGDFDSYSSFDMSDDSTEKEIETHIIDVGVIKANGIFGLGERNDQRYILARTNVQCLLLPRFWLMQRAQNPSKIWQIRLRILQMSIPSREKVFKIFVEEQQWPLFKKKIVHETIKDFKKWDNTKQEDLPGMLSF